MSSCGRLCVSSGVPMVQLVRRLADGQTDGDPFSSGERRSSTDGCDVTVVDTRSESVAKRKIFDSSDGEYVDYVTVKE